MSKSVSKASQCVSAFMHVDCARRALRIEMKSSGVLRDRLCGQVFGSARTSKYLAAPLRRCKKEEKKGTHKPVHIVS